MSPRRSSRSSIEQQRRDGTSALSKRSLIQAFADVIEPRVRQRLDVNEAFRRLCAIEGSVFLLADDLEAARADGIVLTGRLAGSGAEIEIPQHLRELRRSRHL